VRNDVTTDRLLCFTCEHGATIYLSHDLVRDDDCDAELVCNSLERAQELAEMHLTGRQLTSATIVRSVQASRRVNDHEREPVLTHEGRGLQKQLVLLVGVMRSRVCHVVEHLLLIESEPLGNGNEALRSKGTVAIDIHGHAFTTSLADG